MNNKNIFTQDGYTPKKINQSKPDKSQPKNGYVPTTSSGSNSVKRPAPPKEE